jgi:malonyl-CoA/methylmalonyl-CoA synthetase
MLQIISRAASFAENVAVVSSNQQYSFKDLLVRSESIAAYLLAGKLDLMEDRIAFMIEPGFDYVATQWAIWRAGGIAVPLCITYPEEALLYVAEDTQCSHIIASTCFADLASIVAVKSTASFSLVENCFSDVRILPDIDENRKAMILYTSGTTSKPKGVVTTHKTITAQIKSLIEAWQWSSKDHTLCVLPLHHVHGIINVIGCAMWSGAICEFLPKFSPKDIFDKFLEGNINVFMAVPTIYFKLIAHLDTQSGTYNSTIKSTLEKFRLMVSGSAALPVSVMEKWRSVSGHDLLERYGMTEIGMGISNPYVGIRKPGFIGTPLPGVQIRLTNDENTEVHGEPGGIQVKGKTVFSEYWKNPEATASSFTKDGWFKTGDIAEIIDGSFRILGRNSTDIIKSGGYKISALEIEECIRMEKNIIDCSVVGLPDDEWGELIAAALVAEKSFELELMIESLKHKLPGYKMPRKFKLLSELPRNAMGKVTKNELKKIFI